MLLGSHKVEFRLKKVELVLPCLDLVNVVLTCGSNGGNGWIMLSFSLQNVEQRLPIVDLRPPLDLFLFIAPHPLIFIVHGSHLPTLLASRALFFVVFAGTVFHLCSCGVFVFNTASITCTSNTYYPVFSAKKP